MKKSRLLGAMFAYLAAVSFTVSAAFIDNGIYTTDSDSGLDWLDLSETSGMSYQAALATHSGWRYATNGEIELLFSVSFPNYVETDPNHYGDTYDTSGALYNEANTFNVLFGTTNTWAPSSTDYSFGFYIDEDTVIRNMGIRIRPANASVYSPEYVGDFTSLAAVGDPYYGTYLVR